MKIIAHRGYSQNYPENTLFAFEKAIEAGVDMIETDVRLSADNVPMIFHDKTLSRISDLELEPENQSHEELQKLDAGAWFDTHYQGLTIPTLDELLEAIKGRTKLILELKFHNSTYERTCIEVQKCIKDKLDWVEVSSFEDKILCTMSKLNPMILLHKLIYDKEVLEVSDFDKRYNFIHCFDIHVSLRHHPKVIKLIKARKVIFWTVDKEDIQEHIDDGLYGAMSNNPLTLKNLYKTNV